MPIELRLIAGLVGEDEYRAYVAMGSLPIARPGWSWRFRRVLDGIAAAVVFVILVAAVLSLGAIAVGLGVQPA